MNAMNAVMEIYVLRFVSDRFNSISSADIQIHVGISLYLSASHTHAHFRRLYPKRLTQGVTFSNANNISVPEKDFDFL